MRQRQDPGTVASGLGSVPGLYLCRIVVGPRTAELARSHVLVREPGTIRVKGREAPLTISEPFVERSALDPEVCGQAARYAGALAHYRAMRLLDVHAVWKPLADEEAVLTAEDGAGRACPRRPEWPNGRGRSRPTTPDSLDGLWVLTSK